jgi:hypothetical protein
MGLWLETGRTPREERNAKERKKENGEGRHISLADMPFGLHHVLQHDFTVFHYGDGLWCGRK